MPPFNFSDEEFSTLLAASYPLPWQVRDRFISDVANALSGKVLAPGVLRQTVAEIQHRYLGRVVA